MRGLAFICILAMALIAAPVHTQDGTVLKGPKGVDLGLQGRSVGPIKSTDTLWRIAHKVRPNDSVSIYQVMQALYEKNPQAFLDNNLNHMRDGAYLKIPTLAEIRRVNAQLARQKSDQDDELWELKKNGKLDQATIDAADKRVTQARKVDVEEAREALTNELKSLKMEQDSRLLDLQTQFKTSVRSVEEILQENNELEKKLNNISEELKNVQEQLGRDSEIQQQLKAVIDMQNEMIAQQQMQAQAEAEFSIAKLFSNPLIVALLATIPALLIIGAVVMRLRKGKSKQAEEDDEFLPQSPAPAAAATATAAAADPLDLDMPHDSGEDALNEGVQLDDDILPDDEIVFDSLDDDAFEEGNDTLEQDELDSLLNDDIVFDDESDVNAEQSGADDLDEFLQQNFDEADDSLGDEITLDVDADAASGDNDILSADDIDDLFNEVSEGADDDTLDVSDDALAALSEELAEESLEEADTDEANAADEDFDLDDIDSLIDEVGESPPKSPAADGAATDDGILSADDIDDLLDGALDDEPDIAEDDFDVDDIDSLLEQAQDTGDNDALPEESDIDSDDIDSLLEEASSEALDADLQAEEPDDIDSLLEEASSEA
ncbi:FimV/HubP family polar landmark protein, partial [Pseudoalteromonas rubra]